jgi:hypothetical protein
MASARTDLLFGPTPQYTSVTLLRKRRERTGVPFEREHVCGRGRSTQPPGRPFAPAIAPIRGSCQWVPGLAGPLKTLRVEIMSIKLTDAQLLILRAATQREDRILSMPPHLKGAAARKVAAKLIGAGRRLGP